VALSHKAIFNQLESYQAALKINNDDVIVSWLPLYHDMGLIAGFLLPLLYGIPLVLMSPFDWVKAPYRLMQAISEYRGTLCWLPNFAYNFCAKKIRDRDLVNVDLSSLRAVTNCSEPMRFTSHEMFLNRFKPLGLKENALATSYAMAENVFAVTQAGIDLPITYDEVDLNSLQENKIAISVKEGNRSVVVVSAGRPISDVEVKIIDSSGNFLNERKIGEIVIRSNCMLNGYYNRDDITRNSFIDGWFKTGDFGYIADQEIYISGRKKDLIIIGGKNIYPKDLETIAMGVEGVHPGRVVAFGVYNESKGTEDVVIIAEIEDEYMDKKEQIIEKIREKVTRESAIALRTILLVEKKWLIKTSSGKIARALNKKKYIEEITANV
jgi:acyl-CoA synthetase (AMP-forming)/AMP-acid ligase II